MESSFITKIEKNCYKKQELIDKSFARYAYRSMLAGVSLTLTTFAGTVAGDYLNLVHPSLGKFIYAFLFSFGLVYILFLHMELATSNMMYLTAGVYLKKIKVSKALYILFVCTFFNLIGSVVAGFLANQTGVLSNLQHSGMLLHIVEGKLLQSSIEIFNSGILANVFVNIAILGYLLLKEETSKKSVALSAVFMFVYLGLNHVIANFGSFSLVYFSHLASVTEGLNILNILRQWTFAFLGNFVGGGIIMGLGYAWLNNKDVEYMD